MIDTKPATVSVIVPTWNTEAYICQAIDSVLSQTHPGTECIVVDDGSTDGTSVRLKPYLDRIVYIRQDHLNVSVARNAGIRQATGEFIAFLDADDYWEPTKLEKQIACLESDPSIGLVYAQERLVDKEGNQVRLWLGAGVPWPAPGFDAFARCALMEDFIIAGLNNMVVRRKCIEEVGLFDPEIIQAEEWLLALKLAHRWKFAMIPEILVNYRVYGSYLPEKLHRRKAQATWVQILERAFADCPDTPRYNSLRSKALAQAYIQGALVDFGMHDIPVAQERLKMAWELDSCPFLESQKFVEAVAYFAAYLYDTITPLDEALTYVELVFQNLPSVLMALKSLQTAASDLVCTIQAFDAHNRGDLAGVRTVARRAMTHNHSLLRNRGLRSIFAQSLLGPQIMLRLRRGSIFSIIWG